MSNCKRCDSEYHLDHPDEVGLCHTCSHNMISNARGWLETYIAGPSTTRDEAMRELNRLRSTLIPKGYGS